jgi:HK97 family phage prohead protease
MTTSSIHRKTSAPFEIKEFDSEAGTVTALVNTMGVVDADQDRLVSGAFDKSLSLLGSETISVLWGHDSKEVVGKVIDGYEIGMKDKSVLYLEMLFNLDSTRGRDAYSDVRFGSITQWSVGFNAHPDDLEVVKEGNQTITNIKNVQLVEVSAVIRGSSPGTGTLSVKNEKVKRALPAHTTQTTDQSWDGNATIAEMPNDDETAYEQMYAYIDPELNADTKQAYKFPHHEFENNRVGSANMKACQSIIGILNGAMGGADIPDSDRQGVWDHAAKHLRDGDVEVPELKEKEAIPGAPDKFSTIEEARSRAQEIGCDGAHQMEYQGETVYMPCRNHSIYESYMTDTPTAGIYSADLDTTKDHAEEEAADALNASAAEIIRVRLLWLTSKLKSLGDK